MNGWNGTVCSDPKANAQLGHSYNNDTRRALANEFFAKVTQNWQLRKEWLIDLLSDLWRNRGAYPGFPQVLSYLNCSVLSQKYLNESRQNNSVKAYETIKKELLDDAEVKRTMALKGKEKSTLLLNVLPRFNLTKEQVTTLIERPTLNSEKTECIDGNDKAYDRQQF